MRLKHFEHLHAYCAPLSGTRRASGATDALSRFLPALPNGSLTSIKKEKKKPRDALPSFELQPVYSHPCHNRPSEKLLMETQSLGGEVRMGGLLYYLLTASLKCLVYVKK